MGQQRNYDANYNIYRNKKMIQINTAFYIRVYLIFRRKVIDLIHVLKKKQKIKQMV